VQRLAPLLATVSVDGDLPSRAAVLIATPVVDEVSLVEAPVGQTAIKDESGQQNRSLRSLARELKGSRAPSATPKVPSVTAIGEASKSSREEVLKGVLKGRVPSESLQQKRRG
jgi:hypothetical protein